MFQKELIKLKENLTGNSIITKEKRFKQKNQAKKN